MIGIIDYKAGNVASVGNALQRIGQEFFVSRQSSQLERADKIIFPGVGSAGAAMKNITKYELDEFIRITEKPFLGICLGMQLLCDFLSEDNVDGLSIIESGTRGFPKGKLKVPHMGWNHVLQNDETLFRDIEDGEYFYFANSYYVPKTGNTIAQSNYGIEFSAAVKRDNFYGVQFHPEKSGPAGQKLLNNFCEL